MTYEEQQRTWQYLKKYWHDPLVDMLFDRIWCTLFHDTYSSLIASSIGQPE